MSNTIKTRLQLKHDTLENWLSSDLVLSKGEVAFAEASDGSFQMRVGDGDHNWSQLSASPITWTADQIIGLEDAITSLSTTHYEVNSLDELSNSYNNGDTAVVKTLMGVKVDGELSTDVFSHTAYIYDGSLSAWKAMDGNYSADNIIFDSDLTYTKGIGVLADPGSAGKATLTAKGKSLEEVLKSILASATSATKVDPTASYGTPGNYDSSVEVGTWASGANANKALSFKFNTDGSWSNYNGSTKAGNTVKKKDITITRTASQAENFNGVYHLSAITKSYSFDGEDLLALGSSVQIDAIPTSDLSVQYQDSEKELYKYSISGKYQAGTTVPKNNLGDDDPSNKIPAGTFASAKSNVAVKIVAGKRKRFYYVGNDTSFALDNEFFRSSTTGLSSDLQSPASPSKTKSLTIPAGTKRVVFALEGADKTLKTVIDVDGMGLDVAGNFSATNVDIEGANGYTAKTYTVFEVINNGGLKATTYDITVN